MIQDLSADRKIMINEKTHAHTTAPQAVGSEAGKPGRRMTKSMAVVLLIVNGLLLVVIPYVLQRSSDGSNEAVLLLQVAGFAVLAIAMFIRFRRRR